MECHSEEKFYCQVCSTISVHSFVYRKNNIPIFRCKKCGVGRAIAEDFEPEKYYTEEYISGGYEESYVDYLGSEETLRREFRKTVKYLRRFSSKGGKCLEIGCAYGFFLQEARPYYEVYGVEMSEAAVLNCRSNGLLNVRKGELTDEFCREIGNLDVVVMLDVIEHIDNLEGLINIISTYLKPGAILLLTTGDWSSLASRLTGASWRLMTPPGHLWYLTPDSLDVLMRHNGMTRLDKGYPWKIVPFELIIKQAIAMLGWKLKIHFPKILKNLGIPANMFDSMRLVYRKAND
jgi:SAM-dependent methyltransferase